MIGMSGKIGNFRLCGDVRVVLTLPAKGEDLRDFSPPFVSGMKVKIFLSQNVSKTLVL